MTPVSRRARNALLVSVLATVALYVVPFGRLLAWPLLLLSTLAHELGHGIAAVLVGDRFVSLTVYADGSGVAAHAGDANAVEAAFVAAGGLVGPAVAAALLFALGKSERTASMTLGILGVSLVLLDVWVVRNLFGFFFVGVVGVVAALLAARLSRAASQLVVVFVATQLALSVFSRADYLFTPVAQTANGTMPSDVAQIAEALWLPYWVWGAGCGLFSVGVLVAGLVWFLKR